MVKWPTKYVIDFKYGNVPSFHSGNNRAESMELWIYGFDVYCDRTWWRNPRNTYWVPGIKRIPNLLQWNNRYESTFTI